MNIRDYKSSDLGAACGRCLYVADEESFPEICPDHASGKHRMEKYEPWVAIGFTPLYGSRSVVRALNCFQECCGGILETARKLTPEEFMALRTGKARLVIGVEAVA